MIRPGVVRFVPLFFVLASTTSIAFAEDATPPPVAAEGLDPNGTLEEPDPTRLDVERLPPEAIEVDRDMYAHGLFVDAAVGGAGLVGGVGDYARGGPSMAFGIGYELARWLWLRLAVDMSMHATDAPTPPSRSVFELVHGLAGLRLQWNLSARAALFVGGEIGAVWVTSDVLRTYGFRKAERTGLVAGGELGFDWHMKNRHHSVGVLSGARVYPSLDRPGGSCVGVHGQLYLRYVFGR